MAKKTPPQPATESPNEQGTRELIRLRMRHLGWTATKLAAEAGTTDATVSRYLAGLRDIQSSTLLRMLDALGIALIILGEIGEG